MYVQAIDEEARRGAEEFEKEIKDTAAAMRKQLVTKVSQSCCGHACVHGMCHGRKLPLS